MNAAFNTLTFAKVDPVWNVDQARTMAVKIAASLTLPAGQILGEATASPGIYEDYDSGASDGTEVPKAILQYAIETDANGIPTNFIGPFGVGVPAPLAVPAWTSGEFKTTDLTGSIAGAITAKWMRLEQGNATTGVVAIS